MCSTFRTNRHAGKEFIFIWSLSSFKSAHCLETTLVYLLNSSLLHSSSPLLFSFTSQAPPWRSRSPTWIPPSVASPPLRCSADPWCFGLARLQRVFVYRSSPGHHYTKNLQGPFPEYHRPSKQVSWKTGPDKPRKTSAEPAPWEQVEVESNARLKSVMCFVCFVHSIKVLMYPEEWRIIARARCQQYT